MLHEGIASSAGRAKAKVTAYGELRAIFTNMSKKHLMIIERYYAMLSNKCSTIGLVSFMKVGCARAMHSAHEYAEFLFGK